MSINRQANTGAFRRALLGLLLCLISITAAAQSLPRAKSPEDAGFSSERLNKKQGQRRIIS